MKAFNVPMQAIFPNDSSTWPRNGERIHIITFNGVGFGFEAPLVAEGISEWQWEIVDKDGIWIGDSITYNESDPTPELEAEEIDAGYSLKLTCLILHGDDNREVSLNEKGRPVFWCYSDQWLESIHNLMGLPFVKEDWK